MPAPGRSKAVKEATVVILDMAAVTHIIKPKRARISGEYTQMQLLPYMQSQMTETASRVDAIWDTYQQASLKSQTRAKRSETSSRRIRVSAKIPIPKGVEWQKFLNDNQNKDELFQFIGQELQRSTVESNYHLLTTKAGIAPSNKATDITAVSPCQQEEADTRMKLLLRHAAMQGHTKVYARTVDIDVVVLTINNFHELGLSEPIPRSPTH